MEHSYWLRRKSASAANARRAVSAQARLAHLDLAGRYSVNAATVAAGEKLPAPAPDLAGSSGFYDQLETGVRWFASPDACRDARGAESGIAERRPPLRRGDGQPVRR
ncbi:MAG: hypothetical protein ACK40O_03800 [Allosphingosinicella sp.]